MDLSGSVVPLADAMPLDSRRRDVHPWREVPQFCVGPPAPYCLPLFVALSGAAKCICGSVTPRSVQEALGTPGNGPQPIRKSSVFAGL